MTIIIKAIAEDGQRYLVADRLLGENTDLHLAPYPKIISHHTDGKFVALSAWAGYAMTQTTRFKDELVRLSIAGDHDQVGSRLRKAAKRQDRELHAMIATDDLCHKYYSDDEVDRDAIGYPTIGGVNHLLRSLTIAEPAAAVDLRLDGLHATAVSPYALSEVIFNIWIYHLQCGFTEAPSVVNCGNGFILVSPWAVLTPEQQAIVHAMSTYLDGRRQRSLE